MVADQIDVTVERTDKPQECFGMGDIVVKPPENDVLKSKSTLPREVIPLEGLYRFLYGHGSLYGHHRESLLGEGIMQTNRKVTRALLQELRKPRFQSDRR